MHTTKLRATAVAPIAAALLMATAGTASAGVDGSLGTALPRPAAATTVQPNPDTLDHIARQSTAAPVAPKPSTSDSTDLAIGAGGAAGLVLVALGGTMVVRRRTSGKPRLAVR